MRPQRHERILPEARDEPCGPPPEACLYRGPVCGAERLGKEASMEVAVGVAKGRGESPGGMPMIGCPGCNGETMAYVAQQP